MLFKNQGCEQCHRINGEGGRMGPDLSEIGRMRAREHLRQAIVEPAADVRRRYWVVSLSAADGRKYEGFLMNEDTYTVQVIDDKERLLSFDKATLKSYELAKTSPMPSLEKTFTAEEVSDLVAYLLSLKGLQ